MDWYYARQGQQVGPVSETDFAQLAAAGTVTAATLVWQPGMPAWKTYGEILAANPAAAGEADTAVCAVSGKIRPKREMIQYEGQWVSAEHRDEFFQRLREGAVTSPHDAGLVPGPYGYAGFWIRVLAKLLDGLCLMVAFIPVIVVFGLFVAMAAAGGGGGGPNVALILVGYAILIPAMLALAIGYDLYFITRHDATPGKRMLGLKLLRADGSKLSKGRIVGRHFAYIAAGLVPFYIGYLFVAFDGEKRGLHDMMCDTRVIKTRL